MNAHQRRVSRRQASKRAASARREYKAALGDCPRALADMPRMLNALAAGGQVSLPKLPPVPTRPRSL